MSPKFAPLIIYLSAWAFAQETPINLNDINKMNDKFQSPAYIMDTCGSGSYIESGKEFGGPSYFWTEGGYYTLTEKSGALSMPTKKSTPFSVGPDRPVGPIPLKHRVGEWWLSKNKQEIYRWDEELHKWFLRRTSPVLFDDYEVLFDGTILLFNTENAKNKHALHFVERLKDDNSTEVLLDLPPARDEAERNADYISQSSKQCLAYDEFVLIHEPLTGRARLFDTGKSTEPVLLKLPWNPSLGGKWQMQGGPRCTQWIPAPGRAIVLVYDEGSIFTREQEQQLADQMGNIPTEKIKWPEKKWKALKVQLNDFAVSEIEVAPGASFPFCTLDGLTVTSLGRALASEGPGSKARGPLEERALKVSHP